MIRICTALSRAGYHVTLIGRNKRPSPALTERPFRQKRLFCFFRKGKFFYIEYNLRLFLYLCWMPADVFCAIDLDTILPVYLASRLRKVKRVYDAHELFCEMEEVVSRPAIYKLWKKIERFCVPKFPHGYTIGDSYAEEFRSQYGVHYAIVRNATVLHEVPFTEPAPEHYILYQGAVNEGRAFESLIPAMKNISAPCIICGEGNFYEQTKALVQEYQLQSNVQFKGYVPPEQLRHYTQKAYIGLTLFTHQGKSNYLSMANRFFDYMHVGIPQIAMNFPEYRKINEEFEIAVLINEASVEEISEALHQLLNNNILWKRLRDNTLLARKKYNWQEQEKTLIAFYHSLLDH